MIILFTKDAGRDKDGFLALFAAVPGTTTPGGRVLLTATLTSRAMPTTTWVFVFA